MRVLLTFVGLPRFHNWSSDSNSPEACSPGVKQRLWEEGARSG